MLQSGITVAGGGGADTIFLNTQDDINQSLISLDTFNSLSTYDGADFFSGVFVSAFSGVTSKLVVTTPSSLPVST